MLVSSTACKYRGFSLVELMVAVALLGILATLALPSYRIWIQNTRIHTAAESIQNGLQLARAEAVKRNTQVQFVLGANSAWTIGCTVPTPDCPAVIQTRSAKDGSSTDITVAPVPPASNVVEFNSLGTVDAAPIPFTRVNIDSAVLSAADSRDLSVTLGVGGNVRMCDPAPSLASTDPRRC